MAPRSEPLFLARATYRRRRLMDAARLLPFLATFLLLAPILWHQGTGTLWAMAYLFGVWVVLIGVGAWLARSLAPAAAQPAREEPEAPGSP